MPQWKPGMDPWFHRPDLFRECGSGSDRFLFRASRRMSLIIGLVGIPFCSMIFGATWVVLSQDSLPGGGVWVVAVLDLFAFFVLILVLSSVWIRRELVVEPSSNSIKAVVRSPWSRRELCTSISSEPILKLRYEKYGATLTLVAKEGRIPLGASRDRSAVQALAYRLSTIARLEIQRSFLPDCPFGPRYWSC